MIRLRIRWPGNFTEQNVALTERAFLTIPAAVENHGASGAVSYSGRWWSFCRGKGLILKRGNIPTVPWHMKSPVIIDFSTITGLLEVACPAGFEPTIF